MKFTRKFTHLFKLLSVAAMVLGTVSSSQGSIIAVWTFEAPNVPADQLNATTYPNPLPASIGSGSATAFHASSATDWSTPAGNGSAESLSSNTWAVGDYYQFQVSTLGEDSIIATWDQNGSSTGPRDFQFSYSTDGSTFTNFGAVYAIPASVTWNSITPNLSGSTTFTRDLTSIVGLNNQPAVYFRLTQASATAINGSPVATGGTGRIDNFTVVPEPSTMILGSLALVGLGFVSMRKRNA